jgi:hypothetical protein
LQCDLLTFWYRYGRPGRIGLIGLDTPPAKLIGWAERRVTPNGDVSAWVHVFMFSQKRHGVPWLVESDLHVPLPGFRPKPNGLQENAIYKWAHPLVTRARVVDAGLSDDQVARAVLEAQRLMQSGFTYRVSELAEAWVAMTKRDLRFRGRLHHEDAMHCGHFLRNCLRAADCDPFGSNVLPENTVPELFAQAFPTVAEWHGAEIS